MKFARSLRRKAAPFALLVPFVLTACEGGPTQPERPEGLEAAVVVNSRERSLTVIPVENPAGAYTIAVSAEGTPVTLAARGQTAVVPLGTFPFAAVVDLKAGTVSHTVALPEGSGASGVAFLNDSIALVGNPRLNSVTPINVRRGTAGAAVPVGVYPSKIVVVDGRAFVLNAELEKFVPVRPGTITVLDQSLRNIGTIQLSGLNPGGAVAGRDGRLYVVNSGRYNHNNGSLSVVDLRTLREISHHPGFGNFPGSVALDPSGPVVVGVYGTGILSWNPATQAFVRGVDNPLTPGGIPPVSALGYDSEGRLLALNPGSCKEPGVAYRVGAEGQVEREFATGICPFGLAFTFLPES